MLIILLFFAIENQFCQIIRKSDRILIKKKPETFKNSLRSVSFLTVAAMVAFYLISLCICSQRSKTVTGD